jgi:hypothetical protein
MFKVSEITDDRTLVGTVDKTVVTTNSGSHRWVGDGQPGFLRNAETVLLGRWKQRANLWEFAVDTSQETIAWQSEYAVLDHYWGDRARLVLDEQLEWSKKTWQDEIDHDHCAICWQPIGAGGELAYYDHGDIDRVCSGCYQTHVERRDTSFIPDLL